MSFNHSHIEDDMKIEEEPDASVSDLVNSIEAFIKNIDSVVGNDDTRSRQHSGAIYDCFTSGSSEPEVNDSIARSANRTFPSDISESRIAPVSYNSESEKNQSLSKMQERVSSPVRPKSDEGAPSHTGCFNSSDGQRAEQPNVAMTERSSNIPNATENAASRLGGESLVAGSCYDRFEVNRRIGHEGKDMPTELSPAASVDSTNEADNRYVSASWKENSHTPFSVSDIDHIQRSSLSQNAGSFPYVLYNLLEVAEKSGYSHIISWQGHGRAFRVHDPEKFVVSVMPLFFQQTRFSSFQRQIALYGFIRLRRRGNDYGGYYHERFLRGYPHLCQTIQRIPVKKNCPRKSKPKIEPNFYEMPPLTQAPVHPVGMPNSSSRSSESKNSLVDLLSTVNRTSGEPLGNVIGNALSSIPMPVHNTMWNANLHRNFVNSGNAYMNNHMAQSDPDHNLGIRSSGEDSKVSFGLTVMDRSRIDALPFEHLGITNGETPILRQKLESRISAMTHVQTNCNLQPYQQNMHMNLEIGTTCKVANRFDRNGSPEEEAIDMARFLSDIEFEGDA